MTIEYFEPRPPRIAAVKISASWSCAETMENLLQLPGVRSVTVRASHVQELYYTVQVPGGEPISFGPGSDGNWLVSIVTQTTDYLSPQTCSVELLSDNTFQRVYRPVSDQAACTPSASSPT